MYVDVKFTPEFERNIRALSKKYRHIRNDIEPVIIDIQNGQLPGEQVIPFSKCVFRMETFAEARVGAIA